VTQFEDDLSLRRTVRKRMQ